MPDSIVGREYLPNVHIENVRFQTTNTLKKAIVTVAIYDYAEPTWSEDEKFTSYLEVSCGVVWSRNQINQLNSGSLLFSKMKVGQDAIYKLKSRFANLEKIGLVSINGTSYQKFKKVFTLGSPPEK